ncbi:MAG: tetratricopeptide repeat protein [Nitrospirae bacterium]|nr:tetratricopeptide repeat protein [Nitrospirota bacterium]
MKKLGVFLLFTLIGLGIYQNALNNPFHFDDFHHIIGNPAIRTLDNLPNYFTDPRTFSALSGGLRHYRPLVMVSHALNYKFSGTEFMGYHLVNLGFHIGSAFLLFLIVKTIPAGLHKPFFPALAAGLLFLVTPFNSEVINYISARSSVMCAFFFLLAFWGWVKYREAAASPPSIPPTPPLPREGGGRESRWRGFVWYAISLSAFLLAMLTKEMAVTFPVILWLYDRFFFQKGSWRTYPAYLPFALLAILIGFLARLYFFGAVTKTVVVVDWTIRWIVGVKVFAKYFFQAIVPVGLSIQHPIIAKMDSYLVLSLLFTIGLGVSTYLLWKKGNLPEKTASFFILWSFIVLIPMIAAPLVAPYQENRGYLAMAAIAGLLALGLERIGVLTSKWSSASKWEILPASVLLGAILLAYASEGIARNAVWKDGKFIWSDVLEKYPDSLVAMTNLGGIYQAEGDMEGAARYFTKVLKIAPQHPNALAGMGLIHYKKGNLDEAERLLIQSLQSNPYQNGANLALANLYLERKEDPKAIPPLARVLSITPDDSEALTLLIRTFNRMGKLDRAGEIFAKAIRETPDRPGAHRGMGLVHMARGNWAAAAAEFEIALRYMPEEIRTHRDIAYLFLQMGDWDRARSTFLSILAFSRLKELESRNTVSH